MIKVDKSKTLDTKREKLLKELSLKVNQIRERGLKFTINEKECYHKCRDEDNTAILSIISNMETTESPTKPNYRMFQENYMSCWVEPTLAELKDIHSKCFSYISNNIYAEIRRIETEILDLTEENIDNYEVIINETI